MLDETIWGFEKGWRDAYYTICQASDMVLSFVEKQHYDFSYIKVPSLKIDKFKNALTIAGISFLNINVLKSCVLSYLNANT